MLSKVSKKKLEAFHSFCQKQEAYLLAWFGISALVIMSLITPICLYMIYNFGKLDLFFVFMPISGVLFYSNVILYIISVKMPVIITYTILSVSLYVIATIWACIC